RRRTPRPYRRGADVISIENLSLFQRFLQPHLAANSILNRTLRPAGRPDVRAPGPTRRGGLRALRVMAQKQIFTFLAKTKPKSLLFDVFLLQ
ncbi:MAG: hypothetical protein II807_05315, partial [Thermoguttaceae bacterium]|nr:hypothetical protein [Thermoguttaceae bacterium]